MEHIIIETPRLLMVKAKDDHFNILYKNIFRDDDVMKYVAQNFTLVEAKDFFYKKFNFNGLFGFSPIIEKTSNKLIGYGGILPFDYYEQENHYEFGYIFQKSSWGKGYASEIANAQIKTIEITFPKAKIYATVHPGNSASVLVLKKCGMRFFERVQMKRGLRDIYTM